jgi:DNA/RNA-binding domain of Phe-tRNA-synthetase-like protein
MQATPFLIRDPSLDDAPFRASLVWATGLAPLVASVPGGAVSPQLSSLLERVRAAGEGWLPEERKKAVRGFLRHGSYKPAGRAKPSSEYLLAAALDGSFPAVNGPVDANNAVSLEFGYPASVFDLSKVGGDLLLKRGGPGDSYVFNPSGQEIGLEDLLCVWRKGADGDWLPTGNPVKDAMATKVFAGCSSVIAVIYAPAGSEGRDLEACSERFVSLLLGASCGAVEAAWSLA